MVVNPEGSPKVSREFADKGEWTGQRHEAPTLFDASKEAYPTMSPAITFDAFATDQWNANAFTAASVAYRVVVALKKRADVLALSNKLWRLDKLMARLLEDIYLGVEGKKKIERPATQEEVLSAIAAIKAIHQAVERIELMLRYGQMHNNSSIAGAMLSLKDHTDDLLEIAQSIEMSESKEVQAIFDRSLDEYKRGEVFGLDVLMQ